MSGASGLSRRRLLRCALVGAVWSTLPSGGAAASHRPETDPITLVVRATLPNWCAARAVGRAYLRRRPHETDRRFLEMAIFGRPRPSDPARLGRLIAAGTADDFASGHVVAVDGWILAATEARLCALAALLAGDAS